MDKLLVLDSLLDNSNALIFAISLDKRVILANREFCNAYANSENIYNCRIDDFMPADAISRINNNFESVIFSGKKLSYRYELNDVNGLIRYMHTSCFPVLDAAGNSIGMGFVISDVTDLVTKELELEIAMEVFSEGSEGIIITDSQAKITKVNRAFENITGYSSCDVIGLSPKILSSHIHDKNYYAEMWRKILESGYWEGEIWNKRRSGEFYPQWMTITRIPRSGDIIRNFVAVFSDLTQQKRYTENLIKLAHYDSLTGLPNRESFRDRVESFIEKSGDVFYLVFFDVDYFKEINDTHGHDVGDEVLKVVCNRISSVKRQDDIFARMGGDEFSMLLPEKNISNVVAFFSRIQRIIKDDCRVGDKLVNLSVSAGAVEFPKDGKTYSDLIKNADVAMYNAKRMGKNRLSFFDENLFFSVQRRYFLSQNLKFSLVNNEFYLVYQPIISGDSNSVVGVEVLLRWNSPSLGTVPPDEFIAICEEIGLLDKIGDWVLKTAISDYVSWIECLDPSFTIAINVSSSQIADDRFLDNLNKHISNNEIPPKNIVLEITERVAMQRTSSVLNLLKKIKDLGVGISLDDFGTGYSSLSYLRDLPVDTLKVDKSFVSGIGLGERDQSICKAVINLASSLGMKTIAEGVERKIQAEFLMDLGCDYLQGFYYYKPMSSSEIRKLLQNAKLIDINN